jgi:hypothetical protein
MVFIYDYAVYPLCVFTFFALGLQSGFAVFVRAAERIMGLRSTAATLSPQERLLVSLCFARSLALTIMGTLPALAFLADWRAVGEPSPDLAKAVVGVWGSIVFAQEAAAVLLTKKPVPRNRSAAFTLLLAYAAMNATAFLAFLAIVAIGNILRFDYALFAFQHLFRNPPGKWFLRLARLLDGLFLFVRRGEVAAVAWLLYTCIMLDVYDLSMLGFCCYLMVAYRQPARSVWAQAPPPVRRQGGFLLANGLVPMIEN